MFQPLDIFKTDSEGGVLWRSAAEDFVAAKRCIENLALSSPGEYLILDQQTGQRQRMRVMLKDDSIQSGSVQGRRSRRAIPKDQQQASKEAVAEAWSNGSRGINCEKTRE
jgi:hypothetical protein